MKRKRNKPKGWRNEPVRHGLASKGVKTVESTHSHNIMERKYGEWKKSEVLYSGMRIPSRYIGNDMELGGIDKYGLKKLPLKQHIAEDPNDWEGAFLDENEKVWVYGYDDYSHNYRLYRIENEDEIDRILEK